MGKRAVFIVDLGDNQEAFELLSQLDQYRKLLGWSRKQFYLRGAAEVIANNQDNPDLVLAIAEYLQSRVH